MCSETRHTVKDAKLLFVVVEAVRKNAPYEEDCLQRFFEVAHHFRIQEILVCWARRYATDFETSSFENVFHFLSNDEDADDENAPAVVYTVQDA